MVPLLCNLHCDRVIMVQGIQQVLWAKAEGIERGTRLDLVRRTWKTSIWSEEGDEKMTLPDPQVPLV